VPRVDEYTTTSGVDPDDTLLSLVDGTLKNVPMPAVRGYIDASLFSDLDEQVINTCESITGFVSTLGVVDGGVIQLDPVIFSTGSNSVTAKIHINRAPVPMAWYWNAPSDIAIGDYVEAAFDFYTDTFNVPHQYMKAFVASGADLTGTVNYADDFTLQFPDSVDHNETWYTIRIPLTGLTNIRSIGVTQRSIPDTPTSTRAFFWYDNMVLREATGIDRAIYGAPANSHIVIPANYTSAKTQLPIFREAAGITWEDRRT
jgi:hypothetical protein